MRLSRVLAVAGLFAASSAPAFAADFLSAQTNANVSAFLGTSNSGLPGVVANHNASASSLPAAPLDAPQVSITATAGRDTVTSSSAVTASWASADAGSIDSRSGWSMTLPDRISATIAQATTIDQSLSDTQPAWQYRFTTTGLDDLFTMNFNMGVDGDAAGLGAWFLSVFDINAGTSLAFQQLANGTASGTFTQALASGHTFDVRLTSNEGLLLPSTQFATVNGGDVAHFDWSIGQAAGDGGGAGVPEPATWALSIVGFGLVGASMRPRSGRRLA